MGNPNLVIMDESKDRLINPEDPEFWSSANRIILI